ncbi:VPS35 endosomal protein sorting factor-like [Pollicipes pollicipes]|uniref:VPS35 endosomal protein sorting factor-like n=1 Tax=Pollicipes pollicipes TaxID=41117 RepID=UPI001884E569|nr:VPS35 endosomal protein sorting factor-like [Pollicipes pollicipes]
MLEDVSVPQFYPSMFALVTDILDVFGNLVYNRVISKDRENSGATVVRSGADLVSEGGRETCRNWFYKISSIRELMARLYVEMAVLRCYDLLKPGGSEEAARRLVTAVRGLASPLAAGYARCYLSRVAPAAVRADNLEDLLAVLLHCPKTGTSAVKRTPSSRSVSPPLGPAIQWCLRSAVGACAPDRCGRFLTELLQRRPMHSTWVPGHEGLSRPAAGSRHTRLEPMSSVVVTLLPSGDYARH